MQVYQDLDDNQRQTTKHTSRSSPSTLALYSHNSHTFCILQGLRQSPCREYLSLYTIALLQQLYDSYITVFQYFITVVVRTVLKPVFITQFFRRAFIRYMLGLYEICYQDITIYVPEAIWPGTRFIYSHVRVFIRLTTWPYNLSTCILHVYVQGSTGLRAPSSDPFLQVNNAINARFCTVATWFEDRNQSKAPSSK